MTIRSISSNVTSSPARSYSFVVRGDSWAAMRWAFSIVPPLSRYAVIPVARPMASPARIDMVVEAEKRIAGASRMRFKQAAMLIKYITVSRIVDKRSGFTGIDSEIVKLLAVAFYVACVFIPCRPDHPPGRGCIIMFAVPFGGDIVMG